MLILWQGWQKTALSFTYILMDKSKFVLLKVNQKTTDLYICCRVVINLSWSWDGGMLRINALLFLCIPYTSLFFFYFSKVAEPADLSRTCETVLSSVSNFGKEKKFLSVVRLDTCWKGPLNVAAWGTVSGLEISIPVSHLVLLMFIIASSMIFSIRKTTIRECWCQKTTIVSVHR